MKFINLDLFKIIIIILLLGFLYVFYLLSLNGRFQKFDDDDILDTRTGVRYYVLDKKLEPYNKAFEE